MTAELTKMIDKWEDLQDEDEFDEETNQMIKKYNNFLACMLEKAHMVTQSLAIFISALIMQILVMFEKSRKWTFYA